MNYVIPAGTNIYRIHFNKPNFIEYGIKFGNSGDRTPIAITEFDVMVPKFNVEKSTLPGFEGLVWVNFIPSGVTILVNKKSLIKTK